MSISQTATIQQIFYTLHHFEKPSL